MVSLLMSGSLFYTIFLDLDGTLLDYFVAIHRAHSHTRRLFGLRKPSINDGYRAVGAGVDVTIKRSIGILRTTVPTWCRRRFRSTKHFWTPTCSTTCVWLLPDARELLKALKRNGAN